MSPNNKVLSPLFLLGFRPLTSSVYDFSYSVYLVVHTQCFSILRRTLAAAADLTKDVIKHLPRIFFSLEYISSDITFG